MADGIGFLTPAAFRHAVDWGTAVPCGAGHGFRYRSNSIKLDTALIEDEQNAGVVGPYRGGAGNRLVAGDVVMDAAYEGHEELLAHVFGLVSVTQIGTDPVWRKLYRPHRTVKGIFGTLAWRPLDAEEVHEVPTAKIVGFTLKATQGKNAELTLKIAGFDFLVDPPAPGERGAVNTVASFDTVTFPAVDVRVGFADLGIRMKPTDAADFNDQDFIDVNEFTVEYDGSLKVDDVTTRFKNRIDEPTRDGQPKVKVSLALSKYESRNRPLFAAARARTPMKLEAKFTGPTAAAAVPYQCNWYFPSVQFGGAPEVSGAGRMPLNLDGMCSRVTTVPAGLPAGSLDMIVLELVSKRSNTPPIL